MTYQEFSTIVPAFRLPAESDTSFALAALSESEEEVNDFCAGITAVGEDSPRADALCAYMAAARLIDQQNVVLTESGFGVVSNNNVAPASRERVEALRREFEERITKAHDWLVHDLMNVLEWRQTPQARALVQYPIYTATQCRDYGVIHRGEDITTRTLPNLFAVFSAAEAHAMQILGRTFYQVVVDEPLQPKPRVDYMHMHHLLCRYFAAFWHDKQPWNAIARVIVDYANSNKMFFPEYSPVIESYENKKADPTFFFS